jgi:Tol biopolymer transport system component
MNADGSGQRPVGDAPGQVYNPVWSPDGRKIAFYATDDDGSDHVYVMNADGTERRQLATGVWPSWSPEGTQIIYGGSDGLYLVRGDGTNPQRLIAQAFFGEFSPDGSRIAYIAEEAGSVSVNVMRADGSQQTALLRRPRPSW